MSFINLNDAGQTYAPGWFLAHDDCVRETRTIPQTGATAADDGSKYVKMGTIYPANNGTAVGIVYEDRLPVAPAEAAKTALESLGFRFVTTAPAVTRPY